MRRHALYLAGFLLCALNCCGIYGQDSCGLAMQPRYSDYVSVSVSGNTIYTTVQVSGYTYVQIEPGCTLNGVTHQGKVYNTISTTGGWVYGPSVWPPNSINVTNNQTFTGTPGATYPFNWVAEVDCSKIGVFFHDSGSQNVSLPPALPTNFRQTSVVDAGSGDLRFTYAWDSSTGNLNDLSACTVGEIVTYPGTANPFPFPSPPFPPDAYPNPTIIDLAATAGGFQDDHKLTPSTTFVKPYSTSSFTATQYYRYKCTNYNSGNYVNIQGPLSIVRSVSQNSNGTWKFTVTKPNNGVATIDPLP